jgi:hypothetical protein
MSDNNDNAVVRFDADRKARFLLCLRLTGQLQMSAQESGISSRTVRDHLKDDPDFKDAYDEAYGDFKESIETEIMRRAIMGWEEPVYQQGLLAGSVRKYDSRLLELLAKRHIPAYKEKHSPTDGLPIGILVVPTRQEALDWEKEHGVLPDGDEVQADAKLIDIDRQTEEKRNDR